MHFLFSDLTSQDNKLTRGLSVRYDPVKFLKSSTLDQARQSKLSFYSDQKYNISTDISTTPATLANAIIPSS